ncbi:MAG: asparagine synthase (glutamine-hydrolyzing) [Bacteroidia bacterium]
MCGIAGIFNRISFVTEDHLKKLIAPIVHRGPDDYGIWTHDNKKVGFGHRRLSIIDLSQNGRQPFHRQDLKLSITYNGEIYNYLEIKAELENAGGKFYSATDTEVILVAYHAYGVDCLKLFDGMFSFAIWDENRNQLFCARDRFGEKPFHYYHTEDIFVFASEIKQFWSYGVEKNIDSDKLRRFVNFSEVMNDAEPEKTFYKGIKSLKASHYMVIDPALRVSIKSYWSLDPITVNKDISFSEAADTFLSLFNESVKQRLRSDVTVGSSLSGGLDSSSIVYTVNKNFLEKGQQQYTFSARFKNYEKDEGEFIDELISKLNNIKRQDVFLDIDEFDQDISDIIYHQDEPFQSASIFAQYKVMQLARKHKVTVLLDGQGADELLGGYETLYVDYLKQLFHNQPGRYLNEVKDYNAMHGSKYGRVDLYEKDTVTLKLKRAAKRLLHKPQAVPNEFFSGVLKYYITGSQLQQLLRYADRNSMAHSVEVRLPFLSHKLVEFVFSLPDQYKLSAGWPKYILRKAFDKKLPDKITWRKNKVGFETPESRFLGTETAQRSIQNGIQYLKDHHIDTVSQNSWLYYMVDRFVVK